jgi:hypothetical protein
MQNVLSALMALFLIALIATSTGSDTTSASRASRVTFSDDASVRADGTAEAGALIEPPLTATHAAERPVRTASLVPESGETNRSHGEPSLSDNPFTFPRAGASSSVRRACLHVYRL